MIVQTAPRLYSRRKNAPEAPPADAVYIGRGTPWGNPFKVRWETDRELCIARFREYALERLAREPDWLEPLRGRHLVCWCVPLACHGDVIMALLGRAPAPQPGNQP